MLDPKGRQAAIEAANEMAIDGAPVPDYVAAIIRAYIEAIMPMKVSGLVERLRQYEGRSWETTHCYNGTRDEAAISIENLSAGLATVWRNKLEAEDALTAERAAHAETKRELAEARKSLEQRDPDITEFMGRLGSRWFLEQGWFPKSVGAREDDARRALTGGQEDG